MSSDSRGRPRNRWGAVTPPHPRKILFPLEWPEAYGGMENSMLLLCRGLIEAGLGRPVVVLPNGPLAHGFRSVGATVYTHGDTAWRIAGPVDGRKALRIAVTLNRIARVERCEVIHVNSLALALIGANLPLPAVWHHRAAGGFRRRSRVLAKYAVGAVDGLVAPSHAAADHLRSLAFGSRKRNVEVIPNPIDLKRYSVGRRFESGGVQTVLVVGRLVPYKGLDTAVRAFAELRHLDQGRSLQLVMVVTGSESVHRAYERYLEDLASDLGVRDGVVIKPGPLDLVPLMRSAATVWVPSRLESFGRVAAEAMASGVPVVASRVGGLPEVVGSESYLAHPDAPAEFAEITRRILTSEAERTRAREHGFAEVSRFGLVPVARQMAAHYERVVT